MNTQFIIDEEGNKISVIIPIEKYQKMMEALENLEDVKLYDEAKEEGCKKRTSLQDYQDYLSKRRKLIPDFILDKLD